MTHAWEAISDWCDCNSRTFWLACRHNTVIFSWPYLLQWGGGSEVRERHCRVLSQSQWERPENKWLNKIVGLIRQNRRNTDSKYFVFSSWEPCIHAASDGVQMEFSQGVRHRFRPWREVPPFCSFKLLYTISYKNTALFKKVVHVRTFCCSSMHKQKLLAGSSGKVSWVYPAAKESVQHNATWRSRWTRSTTHACACSVNCCVGHWLTDVQWSPDEDHYIPSLHPHTVHPSLKYDKLQVILITYWLLKPWVQGPKEQAWPVQDNWLLKYNVFCKAPNAP